MLALACCKVSRSWLALGRYLLYYDAVVLLDVQKHAARLTETNRSCYDIGRALAHYPALRLAVQDLRGEQLRLASARTR